MAVVTVNPRLKGSPQEEKGFPVKAYQHVTEDKNEWILSLPLPSLAPN